jgi:hypothetical protein
MSHAACGGCCDDLRVQSSPSLPPYAGLRALSRLQNLSKNRVASRESQGTREDSLSTQKPRDVRTLATKNEQHRRLEKCRFLGFESLALRCAESEGFERRTLALSGLALGDESLARSGVALGDESLARSGVALGDEFLARSGVALGDESLARSGVALDGIGALTNCGGFDRSFVPADLSECVLLVDHARAIAVPRRRARAGDCMPLCYWLQPGNGWDEPLLSEERGT